MQEKINIKSFILKYRYELLALLVLLIYLSPNIFFPDKARFLIHDNLDSNIVWYKNLAESEQMFGDNNEVIPISLGGIPRGCYPSELNIMHLLYFLFSPLVAYNLNSIIMHLIAFFGMLLLMNAYFKDIHSNKIRILIALLFSLLPFWPSGGLAIAGQPLLVFAFLNIKNYKGNYYDWLIIILIPFYSLLALSNLFLIIIIGLVFFLQIFKTKSVNWNLFFALVVFITTSIIAEYRLFQMQFIEHFQSHRDQIRVLGTLNINGLIGVSLLHFFKGQYHFHSLHSPFIILLILLIALNTNKQNKLVVFSILIVLLSFSLIMNLPYLQNIESFFSSADILKKITLRFYSLFPLIWFLLLAYSISLINIQKLIIKRSILIVLILQLFVQIFSLNASDYQNCNFSENSFYYTYIDRSNEDYSTFNEYYNPEIYKKIKENIDLTKYTACVGINPEIAQFNGIKTIDGYFYYYPKTHYLLIKRVNEKIALEKKTYSTGNHSKLMLPNIDISNNIIINPEWNFKLLDSLKVGNIISSYQINSDELKLVSSLVANKNSFFIYMNKLN